MVYFPIYLKINKNPDDMKIKDELVLHGMNQVEVYEIENNTIGEFQTSDIKTPEYNIVQWIGNAYNL